MNHTQKKYAMERVQVIAIDKVEAIKKAMPIIPTKTLNYRKALRLIKTGAVKLVANPNKALDSYADFTDVFDFKDYHDFDYRGVRHDTKGLKEKTDVVWDECTRIKDQIMLGDAEEALKLIQAFEKM